MECKVCGDITRGQSLCCQVCSLICHEDCKKSAFSCPPKVNDQQPSYDVSNLVFIRVILNLCSPLQKYTTDVVNSPWIQKTK